MSNRTNPNTFLAASVFMVVMVGTTFAQPFFPAQVGLRLEYIRWDSAYPVNKWTVHMEFDHQQTYNSSIYFHLQRWNYENDGALEDMGYVRSTEDAVYMYNSSGPDDLVFQIAPLNTKWHYQLADGDYLVREIIAIETVTVPYGTFNDAYKQLVYTCEDPDTLQGKSTDWYEWTVPGVAFVKQVNDWVANPPATMELVRVLRDPEATIALQGYFPLTEGITWNYLQTYADGSKEYEVFCIGGTETVNSVVTNKQWEFDSGELEEYDYSYDCLAWTKEGLEMHKVFCSDGSYAMYDPPVVLLPHLIRIGESFTYNSTRIDYGADGNVLGSSPYRIELTLQGEEDVEVPAGTFTGCLRFSGREEDEGVEAELTLWLAPGIGDVKRVYTGFEDRELISFTRQGITRCPSD